LIQVAVFLAAAAIAAPLGRLLRMGSVLGYLALGVVIGPYILGPLYALDDVGKLLHFGEFGVVMLLFVIGLELRPVRLWAMRSAIFGLGVAQLIAVRPQVRQSFEDEPLACPANTVSRPGAIAAIARPPSSGTTGSRLKRFRKKPM